MKSIILLLAILSFSIISHSQNNKDLIHLMNSKLIKCTITEETSDSLYYTMDNSLVTSISIDSVYMFYYNFSKNRASYYLKRATQQTNRSYLLIVATIGITVIGSTAAISATPLIVGGIIVTSLASIIFQIDAWQQFRYAGNILEVLEDAAGQDINLYGK